MLVSFRPRYSLILALGALSACSLQEHLKGTAYLNRVLRPLSWKKGVDEKTTTETAVQLNATYYYLLGRELSAAGHVDEAIVAFERVRSLDPDSAQLHYTLGEEYLKKGLSKEGVAMVKKAIELDPKNRDARLLLASLHATAKKYEDATELFEELLRETPDDEEVVLNVTLLELEQKKYDAAHKRLLAFLERDPESALAYFYIGRLEQERGRKAEALKAYAKAVDLRSGFVQAGTYMGFLQEEMKDPKGAIETFKWLAAQTDGARYHKKLGQLYLDQNDYQHSLESFLNFERVDPQDLNNKAKIGLLLLETKRSAEAEKRFLEVLKESPDSENVRFYLASVYEELKKYPEALREYAKIPESSKLYLETLKRRAWVYQKSNKAAEGRKLIEEALKKTEGEGKTEREDEKFEDLTEMMVGFLSNAKMFDEARATLKKSLERLPDSERFLYAQGILLEKMGKGDEAVASMQKILDKNADNPAALNFIGFSWADQGKKLPEAEAMIRKALKARPQDAFITDSLGWVLYRRARYAEALKYLELAYKVAPEESVISEHLGDVLVKLGRLAEAKQHYEKALQLGPEKEDDKNKLEAKVIHLDQEIRSQCSKGLDKPHCSAADDSLLDDSKTPRTPASPESR